jgi:hypothetical protein
MSRTTRSWLPIALLIGVTLFVCQHGLVAGQHGPRASFGTSTPMPVSFVQSYLFPSFGNFGWFGGDYSPFVSMPMLPPARPYLPKYWWVEPYPSADPRQAGYNPASGYPRDEVTTLLLVTYPVKARIVLDGIYVGTADYLGPIQLPLGEHTLRVEALGYEPSETVISVEQPVLQQLEIRLKPLAPSAKPEPRP